MKHTFYLLKTSNFFTNLSVTSSCLNQFENKSRHSCLFWVKQTIPRIFEEIILKKDSQNMLSKADIIMYLDQYSRGNYLEQTVFVQPARFHHWSKN